MVRLPGSAPPLVRVSFAAMLRIRDGEGIVLFEARSRPGAFTPPGGVFRHFGPATEVLGRLGFRSDRDDLRGEVPARSLPELLRWFDSGAYREDAAECLRRELAEAGFPGLAPGVRHLSFARFRTEVEVLDRPYRQLRQFECYDLVCADQSALRVRDRILALATDPRVHSALTATPADIAHGRAGAALIAPHAGYLTRVARTPSLR
ncbi:hypothetical protein [Kutzneria sp. NPDC052558]|uniref:SMODS-associated NUDIX domain-containing protein n=1 Tax=Kutzneria sp. NPDC052558 TaxID=3364121 RepID=UPI0037C7B9F8